MTTDELNLKTAVARFLAFLQKQGRSRNTIVAYRGDLEQLIEFLKQKGIKSVLAVELAHLNEFKEYLSKNKYTGRSIARKINSLKSFFRFLFEEGILTKNPATHLNHTLNEEFKPRILQPIEYRALRDACRHDPRISAIVELMLQCGLRISEVANLRLEDVGKDTLTIRAWETHPKRVIPLNRAAAQAIQNYLAVRPKTRSKYLFVTKTGRPFLVRNIRTILTRYFQKAGLTGVKINDLRNTFIVHQLAAGVPLEVISKIVGHKRLSTTEKYLRLVPKPNEETIKLKEL